MRPSDKFKDSRPAKGDPVTYRGAIVGKVLSVENELCWVDYQTGSSPFI